MVTLISFSISCQAEVPSLTKSWIYIGIKLNFCFFPFIFTHLYLPIPSSTFYHILSTTIFEGASNPIIKMSGKNKNVHSKLDQDSILTARTHIFFLLGGRHKEFCQRKQNYIISDKQEIVSSVNQTWKVRERSAERSSRMGPYRSQHTRQKSGRKQRWSSVLQIKGKDTRSWTQSIKHGRLSQRLFVELYEHHLCTLVRETIRQR